MQEVEAVKKAVSEAEDKWKSAPAHIRVMAGAYVEPILRALGAVPPALAALAKAAHDGAGGRQGGA